MRQPLFRLSLILLITSLATPAAGRIPDPTFTYKIGEQTLSIGTLIQFDSLWFNDLLVAIDKAPELATDDQASRHQLTRTRLAFDGQINANWRYFLQWQFANQARDIDTAQDRITDAYLGWHSDNWQSSIKVGQFREPLGLENQTSSAYLTTQERSVGHTLLLPERSQGAGLFGSWQSNQQDRVNWSVGLFANGLVDPDSESDQYAASGRLTWRRPFANDSLLHLGLGASVRDIPSNVPLADQLETSLELGSVQSFRDLLISNNPNTTVDYRASEQRLANLEVAWLYGPWSVQAEYLFSHFEGAGPFSDYEPEAGYVEAAWFITGESRRYLDQSATFGPITPLQRSGAWQLYFRYSNPRLDDAGFGDDVRILTLGANWHLGRHIVLKGLWLRSKLDDSRFAVDCSNSAPGSTCRQEDEGEALSFRAQIHF